jgi:histidine ammonia-lyase
LIVDAVVAGRIPAYGINTGVGALVDTPIGADSLAVLSRNLVMSHACAIGEPLPKPWVRAILAAQINNLAHGVSGIAPDTVALMLGLLERDCVPVVPRQGSVGYLAHMAHIALVLIGEGEAVFDGERLTGAVALARAGLRLRCCKRGEPPGAVLGRGLAALCAKHTPCCLRLRAAWR